MTAARPGTAKSGHIVADFDGIVGFVDLAGFTAATERLGRAGPRGTEQLGELINSLFTPAIDIVHRAGGEIGWFAGDALGVLFDRAVTSDGSAVTALAAAARTIIGLSPMQTIAGDLTLSVKVGVAAGAIRWNTIGGDRKLAWFGGHPIDTASEAEHLTQPGDIVVHESVLRSALDGGDYEAIAPGFDRIVRPPRAEAEPGGSQPLARRRTLDHQPTRVARIARAGDVALLDEHRPVSSLFVRMAESTHDPGLLSAMVATVEDMGGLLQIATEGDKGAVALALFGAPTALADRHLRAVVAADRLRVEIPDVAIGIASGRVYAGRVGSDARWDYSLIGDRVNTAARLMQAASPGEVLVDRATADGAGPALNLEAARQLDLKGKSGTEEVFAVSGVRAAARPGGDVGRFVGRRAETAALTGALTTAGLTLVVGPAGTGKSRLLQRAIAEASLEPTIVRIEQTDRGRPYAVWQRLLPALFGVEIDAVVDALPSELRDDARLPLLALALGRPIPDTALTSALDPDDRAAGLAALIGDVVEATGGTTAVVEDLHWSDDSSRELLGLLAGRLPSLGCALVATARPEPTITPLLDLPAVAALHLSPIGADEMALLAHHLWLDQLGEAPRATLVADLVERAGGSPLFCEQLVSFARLHDVVPSADVLPTDAGLPTTLTDLLLARLDSLPETASTVASYGAVFGGSFTAADIAGAFARRGDPTVIGAGIEALRDHGVVVGLDRHRFTHSLFAEAVYDRLSFAVRADLHLAAIEHLERTREGKLHDLAAELARHAAATDDDDRKRRYFRVAADQAAARYANDVSTFWYQALVPLLGGHERGEVRFALGEIEALSGDLGSAEHHLRDAVTDLHGLAAFGAEVALGRVLVQRGTADAGFDLLDDVVERSRNSADWHVLHDALEAKADLATMLGDVRRAEQVESDHGELVARHGPDHSAARPIVGLIPLRRLRGDLDGAAEAYERHHAELSALGDVSRVGMWAADIAGIHYLRGDLAATFVWLDRARVDLDRSGNQRALVSQVLCNEVILRAELGDPGSAISLGTVALEKAIELGSPWAIGQLLAALGEISATPDRTGVLERAVVLLHRAGSAEGTHHALHRLALARIERDRNGEGLRLLAALADSDLADEELRLDLARQSDDRDGLDASAVAPVGEAGDASPAGFVPPPPVVPVDPPSLAALIDLVDHLPGMASWRDRARTVVAEVLASAESVW